MPVGYKCIECGSQVIKLKAGFKYNNKHTFCNLCNLDISPKESIYFCDNKIHSNGNNNGFNTCTACYDTNKCDDKISVCVGKRKRSKDDIRPAKRMKHVNENICEGINDDYVRITHMESDNDRIILVELFGSKLIDKTVVTSKNISNTRWTISILRAHGDNQQAIYPIKNKFVEFKLDKKHQIKFIINVPIEITPMSSKDIFGVNVIGKLNGESIFDNRNTKWRDDNSFELQYNRHNRERIGCFYCGSLKDNNDEKEWTKCKCDIWFHSRCNINNIKNPNDCLLCTSLMYGTLNNKLFNVNIIKHIFMFLIEHGKYRYRYPIHNDEIYGNTPDKVAKLMCSNELNNNLKPNDICYELCSGTGSITKHIPCKTLGFEKHHQRYKIGSKTVSNIIPKKVFKHLDITSQKFIKEYLLSPNKVKVIFCNPEYKLFYVCLWISIILLKNSKINQNHQYLMYLIPDNMRTGSISRDKLWNLLFKHFIKIKKQWKVGNINYYDGQIPHSNYKQTSDSIVKFILGDSIDNEYITNEKYNNIMKCNNNDII